MCSAPQWPGAQSSLGGKRGPRAAENPREACRGSSGEVEVRQGCPAPAHLLPFPYACPPPAMPTAPESWLPSTAAPASLGARLSHGPPVPGTAVVGLAGSPAQVTGAAAGGGGTRGLGPSGITHVSRKIAKYLKDKWSIPHNPSPLSWKEVLGGGGVLVERVPWGASWPPKPSPSPGRLGGSREGQRGQGGARKEAASAGRWGASQGTGSCGL